MEVERAERRMQRAQTKGNKKEMAPTFDWSVFTDGYLKFRLLTDVHLSKLLSARCKNKFRFVSHFIRRKRAIDMSLLRIICIYPKSIL